MLIIYILFIINKNGRLDIDLLHEATKDIKTSLKDSLCCININSWLAILEALICHQTSDRRCMRSAKVDDAFRKVLPISVNEYCIYPSCGRFWSIFQFIIIIQISQNFPICQQTEQTAYIWNDAPSHNHHSRKTMVKN